MSNHFDIIIVGGGMVGASLAHALKGLPLKIGIIEAHPLDHDHPSYDSRAIALSHGSYKILKQIGCWQAIAEMGSTPIETIKISDRGHIGGAVLNAVDEGVDALGYVVEAAVIGKALKLESSDNLTLFSPATVLAMTVHPERDELTITHNGSEQSLTAKLVVAADGSPSTIGQILGEKRVTRSYGQTAIISTIISRPPHQNTAYERFTDSGPLAMLPNTAPDGWPDQQYDSQRWSLVWSARDDQVDEIMALDERQFLDALELRLGRRIAPLLSASKRIAYPLRIDYLRDHIRHRVAFIGNAAHAIHPVAGQGFNLGLRDVAFLAETIANALNDGRDFGTQEHLNYYSEQRKPDYLKIIGSTDMLVQTFSNNLSPLIALRNLGLATLERLPPLRHLLAQQMMGTTGKQSQLASGIPLAGSHQ
ncbi:MAG: 2-octaprenyl-6-methoxyphenyl hydroxylase [Chromatiales bacterium]|nr:2-octaprenyl-6-methoxyphenyl hydroxylase [Chromatiales bacterium]